MRMMNEIKMMMILTVQEEDDDHDEHGHGHEEHAHDHDEHGHGHDEPGIIRTASSPSVKMLTKEFSGRVIQNYWSKNVIC